MVNNPSAEAHIRITHTIHEQIMVSVFTEREIRVLLLILRLSWGCGKQTAYIPLQKTFEVVGVGEGHIKRILDYLQTSHVIYREGLYYEFNKDFDQWRVSRSKSYERTKLTDLVSLNIKTPDVVLTHSVTEKVGSLLTEKVSTPYRKGKFGERENSPLSPPHPLSPPVKESLKKVDNYIVNNNGEVVLELTELVSAPAREIWSRVLPNLAKDVSSSNYRTWLEGTTGIAAIDGRFFVGCKNEFSVDYLEKNLRSLIEKDLITQEKKKYEVFFVDVC